MRSPGARRLGLALALACLGLAGAVRAQPGAAPEPPPTRAGAASELAHAGALLEAGNAAAAAAKAERIAGAAAEIDPSDRAEAFRLLGLARFSLGDAAAAERAWLGYLELDPDAHLDPALVPPEAIVVFEDLRSRHTAELAALRPRPRRHRYLWLNLVPIAGQIQNGERTKAWLLGSAGAALLVANLATYAYLAGTCHPDHTCYRGSGVPGDPTYHDRTSTARMAQALNIVSGIGLLTVGVYSIVDGFRTYRRLEQEESAPVALPAIGLEAGEDGPRLLWQGQF